MYCFENTVERNRWHGRSTLAVVAVTGRKTARALLLCLSQKKTTNRGVLPCPQGIREALSTRGLIGFFRTTVLQ
jgi:hypothetical protein